MPLTFRDYLKKDGWLPLHSFNGHRAIADAISDAKEHKRGRFIDLKPSVLELKKLIERSPDLYRGFVDMYNEAGPTSLVRDYKQMIDLIEDVTNNPPVFRDYFGGAPGLSFNNILGSVIVTRAGFDAFSNGELNKALQKILTVWREYLDGKESAKDALTNDKWLSKESIITLSQYLYDYDPADPFKAFKRAYVGPENEKLSQWGFQSWNAFFSRPFITEKIFNDYRPLPKIPNKNDIISPADSRVYTVATNVSELDTFWLKGHKYSIKHLLDHESLNSDNQSFYQNYIGGTVYQAYLLPSDYHQWTMPFSGTVRKVVTVPGTYFALSNAFVDPANPDEFASLVEGLPFLATVSARKIAIIDADNPKIGTVCFIPVGLQEISSVLFFNDLENRPKTHLDKGEVLGCFQYGGSTVCLVFEPKVNIKWGISQLEHILIRSKIAEVY